MPHTVSEIQNVLLMPGTVPRYSSRWGSDVNIMVFQVPTPVHGGGP